VKDDLAARLDLLDFAWSDLRLDGSLLKREGVASIIRGELVQSVSIAESSEVLCHERAMSTFRGLTHMQIDLDRASLQQIAEAWSDFFDVGYRRTSPVLHHLGFTPPQHADIPQLIDELFRHVRAVMPGGDAAAAAARIHNGIIYIYPFTEHSEMIARAAMQYELISRGLPVVDIGLSEQEYNTMVSEAVRTGNDEPLADAIRKAAAAKQRSLADMEA
jgi:hypothetical protein